MKPVKEGFAELDVPIYFRVYGSGRKTVVFLHGNGENWQIFRRQIEPIVKEGYQVLLIDSRGHGHSGFNYREKLTIEKMADDVYGVLQYLNIDKAYVVGFSDGGNIALSLLRRHPECIEKLIVAGANFYPNGMKLSYHLLTVMGWLLMCIMSVFVAGRRKNRKIMSLMVRQPRFRPSYFKHIQTPVLVMAGDRDMIKPRHTLLIKDSFPNSQIAFIKDSDHFIFYRQPDVVNRQIIDFIND